jgi:hypothetical protein
VLLQHVDAPVTLNLALKQSALLFLYPFQLGHDAAVLLLQLVHQRGQLVVHMLLLTHLHELLLKLWLLLLPLLLLLLLAGTLLWSLICYSALLVMLVSVRLLEGRPSASVHQCVRPRTCFM